MPVNNLIQYLRLLDARPSWRRWELPPQITDDVLIELDRFELIETVIVFVKDRDDATPGSWRHDEGRPISQHPWQQNAGVVTGDGKLQFCFRLPTRIVQWIASEISLETLGRIWV